MDKVLGKLVKWVTLYKEQRRPNEALIWKLTFELEYKVTWSHQSGPGIDNELGIVQGESINGLEFEESEKED
ncbi:44794_t:CDS:2 [Gigaspora margarita]|uniref:44794_t:CDS:1 n=1 Tax=Gigaspora margarita TaxID=4874 RepID=A0ABN7US28_GIGMA|nr:44794_t:CDS:2 [Gigaspora margarita]